MPTIAANTYRLPVVEKLSRGKSIISMSTDNPNAPGNADALAAFVTAQTTLNERQIALVAAQSMLDSLLVQRDNAVVAWNAAINGLAAVTENATGGNPVKILTTGFGVRAPKSAPEPVEQITGLRVLLTTTPGETELKWTRDPRATAYRIQWAGHSAAEQWQDIGVAVEPSLNGHFTTPGQTRWFRVAGVNLLGQGPWSDPAMRPVL